jgi:phenylalanyl-tRNA synthetase alpha chain
MKEELQNLKNSALAQIMDVGSAEELENLRIQYLGRQGKISHLIKDLKNLPEGERKAFGILINETKNTLLSEINKRKNSLKESAHVWFDPTIPGIKPAIGHTHLISQAIEEISDLFKRIGFVRVRYPEVDWDWYAFEALNFAPNHPARDSVETFWIKAKDHPKMGPMVLTPHTSNGQVREMERVKSTPPIRMLNISKCYRRQSDISHTPMFHQFEGLVIDTDINIRHLKGTLEYFAKSYFGKSRTIRLRPHDFAFTEPSFEIDISCDICGGAGCRLCKQGWLELAGAGMVHPNVLKAGGIDPKKFRGFAFGVGVERVLMMKPGLRIPDLRAIYSTDLRYLTQF